MRGPVDFAVIGAGILGAAVAAELASRRPAARIAVLEAEPEPARHQTGRNSGVVHSGIYYPPGSLKARLCREGAERTGAFCRAAGIGWQRRGKLIVATDPEELPRLDALEARAGQNGVAVERLDAAAIRACEPAVAGLAALRVPASAIVDYPAMTRALLARVEAAGGRLRFGTPVTALTRRGAHWRVSAAEAAIEAGQVIACAGLQADRLARAAGVDPGLRIVPFRGEYFVLPPGRSALVHHMIYPVPDPALPFLGVHLTPMIDGTVTVGPNAVLALARTRHGRFAVDPRDAAAALCWPGLWRLLARFPRALLAEGASSLSRRIYLSRVRRYCPGLRLADLGTRRAGIRAQAVRRDGSLVDDFLIAGEAGLTLVLNAPSPAATSALPIATMIADHVLG